ncbi:Fic family protein [uncultured Chryseobacterium sp.]|uniref:Fic family protein n=1 Tax=uncultured Chryseobacterium sp. TaxID=259322 RepID=UPI0025F1871A|nr:Fic family protein [uncultured Chryseobacterium sp.]
MKNIKILEGLAEIQSVDEQKKSIDEHRPFSKELENKIFQKLKLDWNYNSNAIEGNQLSYGETVAFLNFGLTAKGKPFKDHLDIKGHNEAIGFMLQLIKEDRPLSESDIKDLHKIILVEPYYSTTFSPEGIEFQKEIKVGQYKTSPNHVKTVSGDIYYYTNPEEVAFEMNNLLEWYRNAEEENLHPVVMSAIFHHKFTSIHPFDDGNGRLARILSNFILLKHHYPVLVIKNKEKIQYYAALNIADNGIYEDLVKLFAENIKYSFDIMQKAINGENINEPDDLDKEIELFTKQMQVQNIKIVDFEKNKDLLINAYVKDFLDYLIPKLNKIGELFQDSSIEIIDQLNDDINLKPIYNYNFEIVEKDINRNYRYQLDNKQIKLEILFRFYNLINYSKSLQLLIDLHIIFETKSMQYIFGEIPIMTYNEEVLYTEDPQSIFEKLAKKIISYLMQKIKDNSLK